MKTFLQFQAAIVILFLISTLTSIAGMEIFGWSMVALVLVDLGLKNMRLDMLKDPSLVVALAFVVWAALGIYLNLDHIQKPWIAVAELRWILPFLALTLLLPLTFEEKTAHRVLLVATGIATLVALYSISQYWHGQDWLRGARSPLILVEETRASGDFRYRGYGLFKMTLTYACSFAMFGLLPFCISFYYRSRNQWRPFLLLQGASWIIFLSVIMTFSRGLWVALVPVLGVLLWILHKRLLILTSAAAALCLALAFAFSPALQGRLASFTDSKHKSNSERMTIWRANFAMVKDQPLTGVGYQQNGPPFLKTYFERLGTPDAFASHAHNTYLNFLSGTGIVGLLLYLSFVGLTFYYGWLNVRALSVARPWLYYFSLGSLGAMAIFFIGGLTEYNFGDSEVRYQFLAHLSFQLLIRRKIS